MPLDFISRAPLELVEQRQRVPPSFPRQRGARIIRQDTNCSANLLLDAAMDNLRPRFILSIPFMVLGFLLTRSPFMMTSVAPAKPWADGPMKLITTPQFLTKKVIV